MITKEKPANTKISETANRLVNGLGPRLSRHIKKELLKSEIMYYFGVYTAQNPNMPCAEQKNILLTDFLPKCVEYILTECEKDGAIEDVGEKTLSFLFKKEKALNRNNIELKYPSSSLINTKQAGRTVGITISEITCEKTIKLLDKMKQDGYCDIDCDSTYNPYRYSINEDRLNDVAQEEPDLFTKEEMKLATELADEMQRCNIDVVYLF